MRAGDRFERRPDGSRMTVFNAHFDYLNPWVQSRSAELLRARADRAWDGSLQLLIGDFNATAESGALETLRAPGAGSNSPPFQDTWSTAARREGPDYSMHGGTGTHGWRGRIDHILFRPPGSVPFAATLTEHQGDTYPSDHYPVLADIPVRTPE